MKKTSIERIAAMYGCEITSKWIEEGGDALYAKYNDKEEFICLSPYSLSKVDAESEVHRACQKLSGRSLTDYWRQS
jgi:hypothetical protein